MLLLTLYQWKWTPEINVGLSYTYRQLEYKNSNQLRQDNSLQLQFTYQPQTTIRWNSVENQAIDIKDYLNIVKRRSSIYWSRLWWFDMSIVLAVALPSVYRSIATILIEEQEIPTDLVRSTVTTFADQRIQVITQRIMTRANLWISSRNLTCMPMPANRNRRNKFWIKCANGL